MRPPVELHRPTILNIAAIACYCFAMLFHLIAYATDNWSTLKIEGIEWRMGLWHGCHQNGTDEWLCSTDVFNKEVFQTGSDWHLGSRVMMTIALVLLFILEFVIIAYACIKNLERYKRRLVALTIALSVSAAFSHLLTLIMYGSEVANVPDSSVKASFGIIIISMFLEIAIPVLIKFDKHYRYPSKNVYIVSGKHSNDMSHARKKRSETNPTFTIEDSSYRLHAPPVSKRTSVSSLSEAETYKKFAYMEESATSIGSVGSLVTRNTEVTNLSYPIDKSDRASIESAV